MRLGTARGVRWLVAGPIGALLGVVLTVIPATTVRADVVHHTLAGDVAGVLLGTQVRVLPFAAGHVALHWAGNPDAAVTVAFSPDGLRFGPAIAVEHDEVGMQRNDGETYGALLAAGGATVARVTSDRPLGRLTVLALAEGATTVEKTVLPKGQAGAQTATGAVVSRAEWGADESLRFDRRGTELWPPVFQTVQKLVVHHTAGVNGESGPAARNTIRSMYYYHAVTQGWGDIGYNFLIDAAGVVYKGRVSHAPGSTVDTLTGENGTGQGVTAGHAFGYNSGTVGIAMLGTYSTVDAPEPTKTALKNLLVAKAKAHGIDTAKQGVYTNPVNGTQATFENIPGHREVPDNATDCPGGYFLDNTLRSMRSAIQAEAGPADTTAPADPPAAKVTVARRSAVVTWTASTGDSGTAGGAASGVAGYDVWRSSLGVAPARIGSTTSLTFTDTAGVMGVVYDYVVKTYDGAGTRSPGRTAVKSL
jgi:hypothetical protein